MRLTYLSSGPREAVLRTLLGAGHEIDRVYVTDPNHWPKVAPTVEVAQAAGIPVNVLKRADLDTPPEEIRGATCLSVGFGFVFPPGFLGHVGLCLNVHGTLLPDYPGARSLNWVIARGESQSGVTVHVVDSGVDTGPVILQRSFSLSPFETGRSLARKTLAFEPAVVLDALAIVERDGVVNAKPQSQPSHPPLPNRSPEHSRIDAALPLAELVDTIRAADPEHYPAFFDYKGERVCIRIWRPDRPADEQDLI
jgi:methionyl-tRNA formyltransferase